MDMTTPLTSSALALALINPMWGTWLAIAMILSAGPACVACRAWSTPAQAGARTHGWR